MPISHPVPLPARVLALGVRPLQASHLCFNVDGILADPVVEAKRGPGSAPTASLGAAVTAFDFAGFYETLEGFPTTGGDNSRLLYDAAQLQSHTQPYALATLRAEGRKLALLKAINARQNAFWAKYGPITASAIKQQMEDAYSPSSSHPDSKSNRLKKLSQLANDQWTKLSNAYKNDHRTDVVKATRIESFTNDLSGGFSYVNLNNEFPAPFLGQVSGSGEPTGLQTWPNALVNEDAYVTQQAGSGNSVITDYNYRVPSIEDEAKNERAQISLIDQQFSQFMLGLTLPNLEKSLANELDSMDCDVVRHQISVLDTILMSPISGTITGIYKKPGDFVRAGEPVMRVEDTSTVLLVAKLIFPAPIALNSTVTISSNLFESYPTNTISGPVVAVRGQSTDDQWEVIVQYTNNGTESLPLPLGYNFDYDDTSVTITG